MSHYTELKVEYKNKHQRELVDSLKEIFDKVEVHDEPQPLMTYWGVDSTQQQGDFKAKTCHIIVRQEAQRHAAGGKHIIVNDLGFRREGDGYEVFADQDGFTPAQQRKVAQGYTARVAEKALKSQGYQVKRKVTEDGKIVITGMAG